jgi:hypothetical protein
MSLHPDGLLGLAEQAAQECRRHAMDCGLPWIDQILTTTRQLLAQESFCHQHRINEKAFTRKRHFTFVHSMLFLTQKTVRSIQLHVQDFFELLGHDCPGLTAAAWSRARLKLSYKAFVTLNEQAILPVVYRDPASPQLRLWRGYRLLAIDSSLQRLPNQEPLGQEFGWVECNNQNGECGRYPQARLSALTDLLNRLALETFFEPWKTGERDLALEHLKCLQPWDLTLMDRGFAEYMLWARFVDANRRFLCRCQANTFGIVNQLFQENQAGRSVVVDLVPHRELLKEVSAAQLPEVIRLRFVTVRLSTGELEVLATNLLDEQLYPTEDFAALYHYRWGIETYYGLLKSRLDLGNFSGLTVQAIRQDVYSTVFVSNLESILTVPANQQLKEHSATLQHAQQVNHAVSFHAIKSHIITLLGSQQPLPQVVEKMQQLFLVNPTTVRPDRKVPRKKASLSRSLYYQRHVKKSVF